MILHILITAPLIWGIYAATRVKYSQIEQKFTQKELLWFIKWYGDKWLPVWIRKPLYECATCMGSAWSLITSVYFGLDWTILFIIPAVAGINYCIGRLFPYSED